MKTGEKCKVFKISDKFDVILLILMLVISFFCTFVLIPARFWHQYVVKDAVQVSLTPLKEKNAESQYTQITVDHLEIDGHPYDIPDYLESGDWDDSRNDLTWEDNGLYSDSIVLNIPKGGERKLVFSLSIYRGLVQVDYDGHQEIVDCYAPQDSFYKYDLSGNIRYGNGILYLLKLFCTILLGLVFFCLLKNVFLHIEKNFKEISKWDMIALLVIGVFSLFCVYRNTDSPWSQFIPWTDSDNFIYIGWAMSKGQVPYFNIFDHKGFYFFFLQFLGYSFTNSYIGIWFIEWICVFAAQLLSYLTLRRYATHYISLLGVIAGYTYTIFYLCYGNYIETFTMPWIALGLYIFGKYFKDDRHSLSNLDIFGLGVSFMIAMMMRQNSTGIWFLGCYFIIMHQLVLKKYGEILRYGLVFAGSAFIAFLPGMIYLTIHGAWKDFIETYWLFNFGYVSGGGDQLGAIKYFGLTLPGIVVVISAILTVVNRKKWEGYGLSLAIYYSLYSISLLFAGMSGYTWEHYAVIMLPLFPIGFLIFFNNIKILYDRIQNNTVQTVMHGLLGFLIIGFVLDPGGNLVRGVTGIWTSRYNSSNSKLLKVITRRIREKTDEDQKISVIGNSGAYYWVSQRLSLSKYFYQNPLVSVNADIEAQYLKDIESNMPAAIVVAGTGFLDEYPEFGDKVRNILENNYVLDFDREQQQLYFRKDVVQ